MPHFVRLLIVQTQSLQRIKAFITANFTTQNAKFRVKFHSKNTSNYYVLSWNHNLWFSFSEPQPMTIYRLRFGNFPVLFINPEYFDLVSDMPGCISNNPNKFVIYWGEITVNRLDDHKAWIFEMFGNHFRVNESETPRHIFLTALIFPSPIFPIITRSY